MADYLQGSEVPTAIVCYNDQLAIRVIDFLKSKGLKVPADISVVGFDDYQMSRYISPSLTTLNHNKTKMGEDAGQMVLDMIQDKPVESILYQPPLIKRDSAGKVK